MTIASLERIKATDWLKEANHVGGKWVPADEGRVYGVGDPATETRIGETPRSGAVETRRAIDAAHTASSSWSMTTAVERAGFLTAWLIPSALLIDCSGPDATSDGGEALGHVH